MSEEKRSLISPLIASDIAMVETWIDDVERSGSGSISGGMLRAYIRHHISLNAALAESLRDYQGVVDMLRTTIQRITAHDMTDPIVQRIAEKGLLQGKIEIIDHISTVWGVTPSMAENLFDVIAEANPSVEEITDDTHGYTEDRFREFQKDVIGLIKKLLQSDDK